MKFLFLTPVYLLMIAVGMALRPRELVQIWKAQKAVTWTGLILATFFVPPALALLLSLVFRLTRPETFGLFMVGVAPGAPLLTRNIARQGFDMHRAASYQLWAALMVPIMIPILVLIAGKLYDRHIWIPPSLLLPQVIERQLVPIALGMAFVWFKPEWSRKLSPSLNRIGNLSLILLLIVVLYRLGKALTETTPLVPLAALLLAVGSIAIAHGMYRNEPLVQRTFALCNANRHVGLALLISGDFMHVQKAIPAVACYALIAPIVMVAYAKLFPARKTVSASVG